MMVVALRAWETTRGGRFLRTDGTDFRGLARASVGEPEVPLPAVVPHRPDGQSRYDDVGHDGIHRWREAYDDNRHRPEVRAAARLLFQFAHVALL